MLGSLTSWFPRNEKQTAGRSERRRRTRVRYGMEPLEGRSLLSTVGDQPPVLTQLGAQSVEEGSSLAVQVTATDPNPGHTVTYSLDPGAPAGATINPASGLLVWTPPNAQAIYSIPIRATDSGAQGLSAAENVSVMVFDVPPAINAGINTTIDQGTEFVRSGNFVDPNPDSWTATVDYGDGSGAQPLTLNSDKTFALDHTYSAPGNYVVGVTIVDSQGGQGHGYFAVQVMTPSTPNPPTPSTAGTAGTPVPAGTSQGAFLVQATANTTAKATATIGGTKGQSQKALLLAKLKHEHIRIPIKPVAHGHKHH
jgi:PKD domain/Putative Ig domain